jgi:non-ribosomal peptide synthetase component F
MMTLLAAFEILLQHQSGEDDVVVGLDIANRDRPELEPLIGLFVNQLVLRVDLAGAASFREVLGRVRGTMLEAFENRDLPFETLVAELAPGHDLGRTPLFQVKVAFQQEPPAPAQPPGLTVTALAPPSGETRFDLTLLLLDSGEAITGALEYDADLFEPETIARLADRFLDLVGRATALPDARLSEIRAAFDSSDREQRRRQGESFEAASLQKLASLKRRHSAAAVPVS